jgi:hypothetical protein
MKVPPPIQHPNPSDGKKKNQNKNATDLLEWNGYE